MQKYQPHRIRQLSNDLLQGALLVASRQVKRKAEVNAIGAFVLDKLLADATQLRRGVREVRESIERTLGVADEEVRCFSGRFATREEATSIIAEERDYGFEMVGVALEEALFFPRHWIQAIKKGEVTLGGGADDIVEEKVAARFGKNVLAGGQRRRHEGARIAVLVAHVALVQDLGRGRRVLGIDHHGAEPLAFALHVVHDDDVAFGAPE